MAALLRPPPAIGFRPFPIRTSRHEQTLARRTGDRRDQTAPQNAPQAYREANLLPALAQDFRIARDLQTGRSKMFGFGQEGKHNYSINVMRGSSGNVWPVKGTYEEVMTEAYKEKGKAGVTIVIVKRDGEEIARL